MTKEMVLYKYFFRNISDKNKNIETKQKKHIKVTKD